MARAYTKLLLITANVGSIFEDPEKMLQIWLKEFLATVKELNPDFLALHCQEVGGKNYEDSMQNVNQFVKTILASEEMQQYDKARVILDEDFTAIDKFTALGCLYFIHQSVQNVQVWDFEESVFVPLLGKEVLSGNIENVSIKEKAKFPQEFFPDFKWSRKGFIRTRWNIANTVFDLVNIHLFHDASNIVAMEKTPSTYCANRKRALLHTIERFENDEHSSNSIPYFMYGDFNFRLDTHLLIQSLTGQLKVNRTRNKKEEVHKVEYMNEDDGEVMLTVEKKGFTHAHHNEVFSNSSQWLRNFDRESPVYSDKLYEYEVTFPPSYPFSEDVEDGRSYMKTRCPAWCDRIMLSHSAKSLLYQENQKPEYKVIGPNVCMGDHKPIFLNLKIKHEPGKDGGESSPIRAVKKPLTKVISINGEEVEEEAMDNVNIHDYSVFEHEQFIPDQFISSIKRRADRPSFKNVARDVMRVDSVLQALRKARRGSSSDDNEEEEADRPPPAAAAVVVPSGGDVDDGIGKGPVTEPTSVVKRSAGSESECVSPVGLPRENNNNPPASPSKSAQVVENNNVPKQSSSPSDHSTSTAIIANPQTTALDGSTCEHVRCSSTHASSVDVNVAVHDGGPETLGKPSQDASAASRKDWDQQPAGPCCCCVVL